MSVQRDVVLTVQCETDAQVADSVERLARVLSGMAIEGREVRLTVYDLSDLEQVDCEENP